MVALSKDAVLPPFRQLSVTAPSFVVVPVVYHRCPSRRTLPEAARVVSMSLEVAEARHQQAYTDRQSPKVDAVPALLWGQ